MEWRHMEQLIMNYIMQGAYTLALLATGYLWKSLRASRNDNLLIKDGVRSLLRERLIYKCEKCISGGYCSTENHDEIRQMYVDYHALGGNGTVTKLLKEVEQLPIYPPGNGKASS